MKKGISLIVLVITIIVMIIIAGAIILSLNSSNVTGKATWAQISSDRANFQAEYATILAETMSVESVEDDFTGVTVEDVTVTHATDNGYTNWAGRVTNHKSGILSVSVPKDDTNPAGIKVLATMTADQAAAFGLTVNAAGTGVEGYDWVVIGTTTTPAG